MLLEAAHWDPPSVARTARRHKLPSEAAKRFERGVDPEMARAAADRAAELLAELRRRHASRRASPTRAAGAAAPRSAWPLDLPARVAGVRYERGAWCAGSSQVGCAVEVAAPTGDGGSAGVRHAAVLAPGPHRPADLVEEVLRLAGYDDIPSVLPTAPPGPGLTDGSAAAGRCRPRAGRGRLRRGAAVPVRRARRC